MPKRQALGRKPLLESLLEPMPLLARLLERMLMRESLEL